jgi:transcriptional regulator with XRE-family HTH domain
MRLFLAGQYAPPKNPTAVSQGELAHRVGIDRSDLSEVENGHKSVGVMVLDDIAAALELEVTDLFKGYKRPKIRRPS